jgi:capsular polysaccharide biosynthesis protein
VFQSIQLQYNQAGVEIAALRAELGDRQRKIADLRRVLNTAPEVEAELSRLNRDYDVTRAQYQGLVERLERTRIAEDAEATGVVRFEVIDPPSASFTPVSPNRERLILMVLFAGLGLGGALAYLLHQLKPVFSSARQLTAHTGLPVLGVVSMTWLDKYQAQERKAAFAYAGAAGLLIVISAAVLLLQSRATQLMQSVLS